MFFSAFSLGMFGRTTTFGTLQPHRSLGSSFDQGKAENGTEETLTRGELNFLC
jgi:hypothetical protein